MSEENVQVVRQMIDAFLAGDNDAALAAFDAGVVFDVSIRPEGGIYRGHRGVTEAVRTWAGTWQNYAVEILELIDAGDRVLLADRQTGRGKGSGAPLDQRTFWVYTLDDGRIVHVKWFPTRDQALEAAELEE